MKTKLIFNKQVADELIERKHILLDVIPNKNYVGLWVFIFPATERLFNDLTKITEKNKRVDTSSI